MNDAPLIAALKELGALLLHPDVPEVVYAACLHLSEFQTKLFGTVPDGYRAADWSKTVEDAGAFNLDGWPLRLEPSNFLIELLAAFRAFEWPRVLVLIHDNTSIKSPLIGGGPC